MGKMTEKSSRHHWSGFTKIWENDTITTQKIIFALKKKIVQAIWDDLNGSISTANETDKNPGSYRSFPKIYWANLVN